MYFLDYVHFTEFTMKIRTCRCYDYLRYERINFRKPTRSSGWTEIEWATLAQHGYLNCPQLEPTNLIPNIYHVLVGPHAIQKGLKLLHYEHKLNNPRHQFHNWIHYVNTISEEPLQKVVYFKLFDTVPEGWKVDLFGVFQKCTIIKTLVPPTMKSTGTKANWHVAGLSIATEAVQDSRLGLTGDLGRLLGIFCDCSYLDGLLGACPHVSSLFLGLCCSNSGLMRQGPTPVRLLTHTGDIHTPFSINPGPTRQSNSSWQYTSNNMINTRSADPRYQSRAQSNTAGRSRSGDDMYQMDVQAEGLTLQLLPVQASLPEGLTSQSPPVQESLPLPPEQGSSALPTVQQSTVSSLSLSSVSDVLNFINQFTSPADNRTIPPTRNDTYHPRIYFNGILNETGVLCPLVCIMYILYSEVLGEELWGHPFSNRLTEVYSLYLSNMPSRSSFSVVPIAR